MMIMSKTGVPTQRWKVPFGDLLRHTERQSDAVREAIERVLCSGRFVLGPEVEAFEQEFAEYCGAPYCVSCNSGTDAIALALNAHGIDRGDKVCIPANTCMPTVAGIRVSGALPVLCDVEPDTALIDPRSILDKMAKTKCRVIMPVHLYGQPVDLDPISEIASKYGAMVIEDAAQAHGARYRGQKVGSHGSTACWSFYPSKNLGAFGDGGAVTTHSSTVADRLRMLRNYGQSTRYTSVVEGRNSRLDELQAAILRAQLPFLDVWNAERQHIAERYRTEIRPDVFRFLSQRPDRVSSEHLFVVRTHARDFVREFMAAQGVECLIHYPTPVHLQPVMSDRAGRKGSFPASEQLCNSSLSLPLFPEMEPHEVQLVIDGLNEVGDN